MRALIIEDDKIINENIKKVFEKKTFAVDQAFNGDEGLKKSIINEYDIVIADLNIPIKSGMEFLKGLRESKISIPVIFLTASDDIKNIENAFNLGVDDYIIKPFDLNVLFMKAMALIKRTNNTVDTIIEMQEISLNTQNKEVFSKRVPLTLTTKQYAILEYLALNRGRFVSSEELISHVWNEDVDEFSNSIRTHIANLRKKVGNIIESKTGFGYKIN